jgi:hypothetical protein
MKKTIGLSLIMFLSFSGCNDLSLEPLDKLNAETFYKTHADFDAAIFATYSSIQDFWNISSETLGEDGEYWKISLATTDDVAADGNNGGPTSYDELRINPSDNAFAAIYAQIYEGILRANIVLHNLDLENELTDEEKDQFEGEAKFLRAFFHFEAMKWWGTPPLVTEAITSFTSVNDLKHGNATPAELYAQILSDFQDAFAKLPDTWDSGNTGRATKWAAKAYEGKVLVWKGDWALARTAFEDVIASNKYQLIDTDNPAQDLEDVFAFDNENNSESIFEVQFGGPFSDDNIWVFDDTHTEAVKASQGTSRNLFWDAANGAPGGKAGYYVPTQDLVNTFEPGDARLEAFIYGTLSVPGDEYYYSALESAPYDPAWSPTGFNIKKYRGRRNDAEKNYAAHLFADFNNERLFRYAELKLLYAETLIKTGDLPGAENQINDIRNRAGLSNVAPFGNATDAMNALIHEKRVELAFEGQRWFDIVRWDIGATVFGASWDPKLSRFPFPQIEIDRVGEDILAQNPGY